LEDDKIRKLRIVEDNGVTTIYELYSQSDPNQKQYITQINEDGDLSCSCLGFRYHGHCHHIKSFMDLLGIIDT